MSHTPFIIASYIITAALLSWCALAPLVQGKKIKEAIFKRSHSEGDDHASST
jgi:hypothetical protein